MNGKPTAWALVCLLLLLTGCREQPGAAPLDDPRLAEFGRGEVRITTAAGVEHVFRVYLVTNREQSYQGLMFVESLPPDTGMLFAFAEDRIGSIWMKNTLLPLDIVFIRRDGTIANIVANATPGSLKSRTSDGPVRAVLELNGGTASRLGIAAGDTARFPREPNY